MKEKYKEYPKVSLYSRQNSKITSQIRGFSLAKLGFNIAAIARYIQLAQML
jgi:hypothetical protein